MQILHTSIKSLNLKRYRKKTRILSCGMVQAADEQSQINSGTLHTSLVPVWYMSSLC